MRDRPSVEEAGGKAAEEVPWTEGPSRRLVSAQLDSQMPHKRYARPGLAGPFPLFISAVQAIPAHVRSPPVQPSRPRALSPRVPRKSFHPQKQVAGSWPPVSLRCPAGS